MNNIYDINEEQLYNLSILHFDISWCGFDIIGNSDKYDNITTKWESDQTHKLYKWDYHRIWYIKKGSGFVKTTFGDIELKINTAYYIPNSTIISTHCDDYMEQYYIDFFPSSDFLPIENIFIFNNVNEKNPEFVFETMKQIIFHFKNKNGMSQYIISTLMASLLVQFVQEIKKTKLHFGTFKSIIEKINNFYYEDIKIESLADSVGYNVEYFSRCFKKCFNVSPQQFIINKRISVAKHLLLTTDYSISQIATLVGYEDPLYFSKIFSKNIHISPKNFRLLLQ